MDDNFYNHEKHAFFFLLDDLTFGELRDLELETPVCGVLERNIHVLGVIKEKYNRPMLKPTY